MLVVCSSHWSKPLRSAFITVVLSNAGQDAYNPDVWGSEIVIERQLRRVGGASFKVFGRAPKNAGDRDSESAEWTRKTSIFTTAKDVEQIVDHFNIQGIFLNSMHSLLSVVSASVIIFFSLLFPSHN